MTRQELINFLVWTLEYSRKNLLECSSLQLKKIACQEKVHSVLNF